MIRAQCSPLRRWIGEKPLYKFMDWVSKVDGRTQSPSSTCLAEWVTLVHLPFIRDSFSIESCFKSASLRACVKAPTLEWFGVILLCVPSWPVFLHALFSYQVFSKTTDMNSQILVGVSPIDNVENAVYLLNASLGSRKHPLKLVQ